MMDAMTSNRPANGRPAASARVAVLLVVVALVGAACHRGGAGNGARGEGRGAGGLGNGGNGNGGNGGGNGNGGGGVGSPPPAPTSFGLGQVSEAGPGGRGGQCLPGLECRGVQVTCPGVQRPARAVLGIGKPSGTPRGLIVFFSGGGGTQWWAREASNDLKFSGQSQSASIDQQAAQNADSLLADLQSKGFETVQARWVTAWIASSPGEEVGPAVLACRPASLLRYLHDTLYDQLGAQPSGDLACGFCATGNSGGGAAIAYALSFYGLGSDLQGAVLTSGPPYGAIDKACLDDSGWAYKQGLHGVFDASYGFFGRDGPCFLQDAAWRSRWAADSVDGAGRTYDLADTRILMLLGRQDPSNIQPHAKAYYQKLRQAGSPHLELQEVGDMTHAITASTSGLGAMEQSFVGTA
jgi:hypothetical protein